MAFLDWLWNRFRPKPPVPPPPPVPPAPGSSVLGFINAARERQGISPLSANPQADEAAQGHANQMLRVDRLAHEGIGDGTVEHRLYAAGLYARSAGEVIAHGQRTPAEVVDSWLASSGHRAVILGQYTQAGMGRAGDYWCVVVFA